MGRMEPLLDSSPTAHAPALPSDALALFCMLLLISTACFRHTTVDNILSFTAILIADVLIRGARHLTAFIGAGFSVASGPAEQIRPDDARAGLLSRPL